MTSPSLHTIILDLGNVILPFDLLPPCVEIGKRCGLDGPEVMRRVYRSNLERWFEAGLIDGDQFTERLGKLLGTTLDEEWLRPLWSDIFVENKDVSALVRRLKNHHPLIILSNTCVWHWELALSKFPILHEIPNRVLSYEEKAMKPHPAIYRAALERAERGRPAIFIDDIENNAAAASMLGIKGIHFQSAALLERELRALGCVLD